jgi:CrcB protein
MSEVGAPFVEGETRTLPTMMPTGPLHAIESSPKPLPSLEMKEREEENDIKMIEQTSSEETRKKQFILTAPASFDDTWCNNEIVRLRKLDDHINLVPSAQNLLRLTSLTPPVRERSQVSIDHDFFPMPDADESATLSIFDKSTKKQPAPRAAHVFRRQLSLPVTPIEIRGAESFSSSSTESDIAETKPLKRRFSSVFRGARKLSGDKQSSSMSEKLDNRDLKTIPSGYTVSEDDEPKQQGLDQDYCSGSMDGVETEVASSKSSLPKLNRGPLKARHNPSKLHRRKQAISLDDTESCCAPVQSTVQGDPNLIRQHQLHYVLYLSAFAILGSTIRIYLARLFGEDCEDSAIDDFLTPLSSRICVTAGGRSEQTGGALFRDLPANVLGSFIMGLITPLGNSDTALRFPWFQTDHPLQKDDVLYSAFNVGLCGSLTTFASWNTQMVVMMVRKRKDRTRLYLYEHHRLLFILLTCFQDGTYTELGPQVVAALVGFMLGMMTAVASFQFGRHVSSWLQVYRTPATHYSDESECEVEEGQTHGTAVASGNHIAALSNDARFDGCLRPAFRPKQFTFLVVGGLLSAYLVGYQIFDIPFYRKMFLVTLLSPPGALLRWNLAKWNSRTASHRVGRFIWIPLGTFTANIIGSFLSILCCALLDRYFSDGSGENQWAVAFLQAVGTGFAGCLSTVSSMVKEYGLLTEQYPNHAKPYFYLFGTLAVAMLMSICIYSSIVRAA